MEHHTLTLTEGTRFPCKRESFLNVKRQHRTLKLTHIINQLICRNMQRVEYSEINQQSESVKQFDKAVGGGLAPGPGGGGGGSAVYRAEQP